MKDGLSAIDYWFSIVSTGERPTDIVSKMYERLAEEIPPILSVVGERTCNLSCAHCIFQDERPSSKISNAVGITESVKAIVQQMNIDPIVVHEGRIFRPSHLEWLSAVRTVRADSHIGMIDNGTFLKHSEVIVRSGFKFDWLDISLDGPETIHNLQRRSEDAFHVAVRGINSAREFVKPGGKVTSLFTLTSLNHSAILDACRALPKEVDEWHVTTLSPARPEIAGLVTRDEQFAIAWKQVVTASKERQLYFRMYVNDELPKLVRAVGREKFARALEDAKVADVAMILEIDGVTVIYYPTSLVVGEEVILDADSYHRMPYSIAYTLEELRSGKSRFGEDVGKYTVGPIRGDTNLSDTVRKATLQWGDLFGKKALEKEIRMFSEIYQRERG